MTVYADKLTWYFKYKNTQKHTYTDQSDYKYKQVLNKRTACKRNVLRNTQTNMQISHRHTRTVNKQYEYSKTLYKKVPKN